MAAKRKTDWEALEPHYRAGIKSLRQLASEFGCTSGRVAQIAKERGWTRDLYAKIKAKAEAKLSKAILSDESKRDSATEQDVVEAHSDKWVSIQLSHQAKIQRAIRSWEEVQDALDNPPADMTVAARVDCGKKNAESLKTLIGLERESNGMDKKAWGKEGTIEDLFTKLDQMGVANG